MNVKTYSGHLPFCASLAFIAWTLCWPRAGVGDSAVLEPARNPSADAMCRDHDRGSGKRLGTFSEEIMSKGVCDGLVPDRGRSKPGRRAWSKLHYQEYLGERISVNPNRYKDFCFCFVTDLLKNLLLLLPSLVFCFWFSFLKPCCLLNSCFPPFLCPSPPHTILFLSIFKALSQTVETGDLGRGKHGRFWLAVKGSLLSTSWNYSWQVRCHKWNTKLYRKNSPHFWNMSFSTIMGKYFGDYLRGFLIHHIITSFSIKRVPLPQNQMLVCQYTSQRESTAFASFLSCFPLPEAFPTCTKASARPVV